MNFKTKVVGRIDIPSDSRIVLDHLQVHGKDYSECRAIQFCTIGCRLVRCNFDRSRIEHAQFGSGHDISEFVDCSFDGAHIEMGSGGFSRFVNCTFRDVDLKNWICFEVELIDCILSGRLKRAIFNGSVRADKRAILGRERNQFHGNDFSAMELIDVSFRTGIDLTKQTLPSGPQYLYLKDAASALERVAPIILTWHDLELKEQALVLLERFFHNVKEEGQRQLFLRADDYYTNSVHSHEAVNQLFDLLRNQK